MSSNLECVGLGVQDHEDLGNLVQAALATSQPLARLAQGELRRWQDPSGARLILTLDEDGQVTDLLPSYAGQPGARLLSCQPANDHVCVAGVVDGSGEQVSTIAFAPEQQRQLMELGSPVSGDVAVTALGVDVTVHPDADSYSASDASLLEPAGSTPQEAPAEYVLHGWAWPPRMAPESFVSHGAAGDPSKADAHARVAGTVLGAEQRTVSISGQGFVVARVRTSGFELDMCLAATEHQPPVPGSVVSGTVFLVGSLEGLLPEPDLTPAYAVSEARPVGSRAKRRRWFGRD